MICRVWNWKSADGESHSSQLCTAADEFTYQRFWGRFRYYPKWSWHPRSIWYRLRAAVYWKVYDVTDDSIRSGINAGICRYTLFLIWRHHDHFAHRKFSIRIVDQSKRYAH